MAHSDQLENYFSSAKRKVNSRIRNVGAEIETFFINDDGSAITLPQSQEMFVNLRSRGWDVEEKKGDMVTKMRKGNNLIQYDLGYPNIELSIHPWYEKRILMNQIRSHLDELYGAARLAHAHPTFAPIFETDGNYLAIPDERDAAFVRLDGKAALVILARTSSVQFTADVHSDKAIPTLNRLNRRRSAFLHAYDQDGLWKEYMEASNAGYRADRYGGPRVFENLADYCEQLSLQDVIVGDKLVPFRNAVLDSNKSVSLFVRSVWWHFRLRRYDDALCIETRPLSRRGDDKLSEQYDFVLESFN